MTYSYFPGCKIPHHLPAYGQAVTALCETLGIDLVSPEFNCCGYPVRHQSFEAWILSSARNFAIAARTGHPIMTPCKCCFGNLKHAAYWLNQKPELRRDTAEDLAAEGLALPEQLEAYHLLTVLDKEIGIDAIASRSTAYLSGLKVAAHYGCHALRPGNVTGFDDPLNPTIFERLLTAFGAEPVQWPLRVECCGNPLRDKNDALSDALMYKKFADAKESGADVIATACTYCQLQFDAPGLKPQVPSILAAQLFGLALGLAPTHIGLDQVPAYLS